MADKNAQLILDALGRAVLEPDGFPLHGTSTASALFPSTSAARQVAQRCKSEGLLRTVRTEKRGKNVQEYCTVTEKGRSYLLDESNPKDVLEDFVRALETRHRQFEDLVASVRSAQKSVVSLREVAETVLKQFLQERLPADSIASSNGVACSSWQTELTAHLAAWHTVGTSGDCPLPEIFRHLRQSTPTLSIGQFHDGLRQLYQHGQIYLHPWTGPLYEMPEPQFALLIGHEIVYYASLRDSQNNGPRGEIHATSCR